MTLQSISFPDEEWLPISGYGNFYLASNLGRIWSIPRLIPWNGTFRPVGGRVLKAKPNRNGYMIAYLSVGGKNSERFVHRLVCEAFHGPQPSPNHEVAHFDNVRNNNISSNLRWATRPEQAMDKRRHGTFPFGMKAKQSDLTDQDVINMRKMRAEGVKLSDLTKIFGLKTDSSVSRICSGKSWSHLL